MTTTKTYLGDSVYADHDGYHIVLTTENDESGPSNTIALEPPVLDALDRYRESLIPKPDLSDDVLDARTLNHLKCALKNADDIRKGGAMVAPLIPLLSKECEYNPSCGMFWFTTKSRDDVQVLMQLAPRWDKEVSENGIDYTAWIDGLSFRIQTRDGALPPTCKLVEKEVTIPAQPERVVKKLVVECEKLEAQP